jgi:hypothetical protein
MRRPCITIPFTIPYHQARYEWVIEHVGWTIQNWKYVLFTDESRFCLDITNDRCARVSERPGERFPVGNIVKQDRYGAGSVIVLGRTDLVVLCKSKLTGHQYTDDMFDTQDRLYAEAVGNHFVLMDDNARPHRTPVVLPVSKELHGEGRN